MSLATLCELFLFPASTITVLQILKYLFLPIPLCICFGHICESVQCLFEFADIICLHHLPRQRNTAATCRVAKPCLSVIFCVSHAELMHYYYLYCIWEHREIQKTRNIQREAVSFVICEKLSRPDEEFAYSKACLLFPALSADLKIYSFPLQT